MGSKMPAALPRPRAASAMPRNAAIKRGSAKFSGISMLTPRSTGSTKSTSTPRTAAMAEHCPTASGLSICMTPKSSRWAQAA